MIQVVILPFRYEGDSSPTRGDLYQAGDNYKTVTSQFQDMINFSPNGVATIESLTNFRSHRFDQQIATNPYFFNGPFTGVLVQPAAYAFIYRFMANHSAENTEGELTHSTLQSWFGVEGTDGNYNAVQGTERIPENWVSPNTDSSFAHISSNLDPSTAALKPTHTK